MLREGVCFMVLIGRRVVVHDEDVIHLRTDRFQPPSASRKLVDLIPQASEVSSNFGRNINTEFLTDDLEEVHSVNRIPAEFA